MSVNYHTLKHQLNHMEQGINSWYDSKENPSAFDDVDHETTLEVISDLRRWMEEA